MALTAAGVKPVQVAQLMVFSWSRPAYRLPKLNAQMYALSNQLLLTYNTEVKLCVVQLRIKQHSKRLEDVS